MKWFGSLVALALVLASCAPADSSSTTTAAPSTETTTTSTTVLADWLTPAEEYLAAYEQALNAHDAIGAAAFFMPDALLSTPPRGFWGFGRSGIEQALRIAFAADQDFGFTSSAIFVGADVAAVLGRDHLPSAVAAVFVIVGEGIVWQVNLPELAFEEARLTEWVTPIQEPNTRAALADVEAVYRNWASAWNSHDEDAVLALFTEESRAEAAPVVADILTGHPDLRLDERDIDGLIPGGPPEPALFFGGSPGDRREVSAVGVYTLTSGECPYTVATSWLLDRGEILGSSLAFETGSLRRCGAPASLGFPEEWWWTSITPPEPARLVLTGDVVTPTGHGIDIYNGSDALEELVTWALHRYQVAGMAVPEPNSIAFPPSPRCRGVSGLAVDTGEGLEVQMCFGEEELCKPGTGCTAPSLVARLNLLHELAHVWLSTHVDEAVRAEFLELRGLDLWWGSELPWVEMGVEHAAEITAWGLMDEPVPLPRLPDDSCETLAGGFRLLTGREPIVDTSSCAAPAG